MQTQEVAIKPSLKVVMKSDTEMLDEVMVVAFGTAKKSAFTGSAKVVGTEKLEQSQVTNVTDALAGAVPGVTLTSMTVLRVQSHPSRFVVLAQSMQRMTL